MEEDFDCHHFDTMNNVWPDIQHESSKNEFYWQENPNDNPLPSKLSELYEARQRFKLFAEQLGDVRRNPIRQDILKYCEASNNKKEKIMELYYKPETILKKIQIRIEKMIKTKRIKRNWGEQDIKILLWIISKYADLKCYEDVEKQLDQNDWKFIATLIPGVTDEICMFKWLSLKKVTLSTNCWDEEESKLLSFIVKERTNRTFKHNSEIHDWKQISQELYLQYDNPSKVYRNAKQCRQHWTCYLSPQLKKGPWQLYEDVRLLKFIQTNKGLKKWSEISKHFEGRTENALKNRYTLIVDKQKRQAKNKHKTELELVGEYLEKCYVEQYTSQKAEDQEIFDEEPLAEPSGSDSKRQNERGSSQQIGNEENMDQGSIHKKRRKQSNKKMKSKKMILDDEEEYEELKYLRKKHASSMSATNCAGKAEQSLVKIEQSPFQMIKYHSVHEKKTTSAYRQVKLEEEIFEHENAEEGSQLKLFHHDHDDSRDRILNKIFEEIKDDRGHHKDNSEEQNNQSSENVFSLSKHSHSGQSHLYDGNIFCPEPMEPYAQNNSNQTSVVTPMKVQKFEFKNFDKAGMESFLKQIQPGVIDSKGTFKKMQNTN